MLTDTLRERIEVWTRTVTVTALGHSDPAWTLSRVVWGRVVPLAAANLARFAQLLGNSEVSHEIVLRGEVAIDVDETQLRCSSTGTVVTYEPLRKGQYASSRQSTRVLVREAA